MTTATTNAATGTPTATPTLLTRELQALSRYQNADFSEHLGGDGREVRVTPPSPTPKPIGGDLILGEVDT